MNLNSTDNLLQILSSMPQNIDTAIPRLDRFMSNLSTLISALDKCNKSCIYELDNLLTQLDDLAGKTLSAGENVLTVQKSAAAIKQEVHSVRERTDNFNKKIEPVNNKLKLINDKIKITGLQLKDLKKISQQMYSVVSRANRYGSDKDSLEKYCSGMESVAVFMDKSLEYLNGFCETQTQNISSLKDVCFDLLNIEPYVEQAMSEVIAIIDMLISIKGMLNKTIASPYGLKIKGPWYAPWKWKIKTVTFSHSVRDVLKGVNTNIDYVNDQLMKMAQDVIKSANTNFPEIPDIHGLEDLKENIDGVYGIINNLDDLNMGLFDDILKNVHALEVGLSTFNVKYKD